MPSAIDQVILKRKEDFTNGSLFRILGTLTLGTDETAIYIDDNKDVKTLISSDGVVFDVQGNLIMENGLVMNVDNLHGYTGPIKVKNSGTFTMNGGRISHNSSYEQDGFPYSRATSAGAVYVIPGGIFNMNNGIIDNNMGNAGAVLVGDLFGSSNSPATINMLGGIIANNKAVSGSNGYYALGGGISGFPKSLINFRDGIIAGNTSTGYGSGGGISITDQFIGNWSNAIGREYANTSGDYEAYLVNNKAQANINGGLIYGNAGKNGGGLFIDTNHVVLNKTMI